ncbi:3-methyl-2-oxobutanoate hydroxymethyltransferase [Rhizobium sp. NLR9b]|uniref:3-methyl-2-oxobutanoate hydroxymethyltransferase n=1 Tax=unclassified Rhizobium TaxID=2613769 RepID=UPI001C838470|nr:MULTISPECIES: 3-methyl-2-oxobutanoate hydroxymethyltransferase [unclassified Rhizobium]MBX5230642.1 3-methyl-2-oxobutanoate hydroxymethyltransferase [Rhizobium sp. NLR9b]MBX5291310.1 3-methyl-2-oxobutanoate hydroxymethyltransferase [Rhizobium sp. NLR10b]
MTRRTTVHDLQSQKGSRKWLQLHVDNAEEAAAAVECGITILSCEPDHNLEAIRSAVPFAFLSVGMAHGAVSSQLEAIRLGFQMLKRGADSIYCSHSPFFIEAMAREGIPVTGHVGLVPNRATWTNFRAIGRTPEEALRVLRAVRDLENAGAAAIEVEVVPVRLADYITRNTPMITMGMGCGSACDTQYLFSSDVLGTHADHYPRHAKRYADFVALTAELQTKRVEAFRAFAADVASGAYPETKHQVDMDDAAFERFFTLAQSI